MLNDFSEKLNIDFLKENWYYKINYLGFANILSEDDIERHYIFETHGEKFELVINTEGYMYCKKFETLPCGIYENYVLVSNPKLERISLEEYIGTGRKKAEKVLLEVFGENCDYENALNPENAICFDKIIIIYNNSTIICPPYYGVNVIDEKLALDKVSREAFLDYVNQF